MGGNAATAAGAPRAAVAWAIKLALPPLHLVLTAVLVLGTYGAAFLASAAALGVPEARAFLSRRLS
jgi:hypothetical protein